MATQTRKRKKKKSGKYTPLIWLITGALIALSIVYSNTLFRQRTDDATSAATNESPLSSLESVASNIFSARQSDTEEPEETEESVLPDTAVETTGDIKIYLALQDGDIVKLVEKDITLRETDSKLKETLEALLEYRDSAYLNLVPFNTSINDVWIESGIAYIDFNENIAYNSYGLIGYQLQVYQIVYTATQFPTVDAVYFYMDGNPLEYLGGDGLLLHNPIYPLSYLPEFSL